MLRTWLVKSEPGVYSFGDLLASPGATTLWDGVRNYEARNFMREMREGDRVLFYHSGGPSNTLVPEIVGVAEVVREAYADPSQFDPESPLFDVKASPESPRWLAVDLRARERLPRPVALAALRLEPALAGMRLLRRGNRLSVMPLTQTEYEAILALAGSG